MLRDLFIAERFDSFCKLVKGARNVFEFSSTTPAQEVSQSPTKLIKDKRLTLLPAR